MKFWAAFFQMLSQYQKIKYELKCNYEMYKAEMYVYTMKQQKEIHTKN